LRLLINKARPLPVAVNNCVKSPRFIGPSDPHAVRLSWQMSSTLSDGRWLVPAPARFNMHITLDSVSASQLQCSSNLYEPQLHPYSCPASLIYPHPMYPQPHYSLSRHCLGSRSDRRRHPLKAGPELLGCTCQAW